MKINTLLCYGETGMFPEEFASGRALLDALDRHETDLALVQTTHTNTSFDRLRKAHDDLASLSARSGNGRPRIVGLAAMNPHFDWDIYWSEVSRCIVELGFAGIVVSPHAYAFNPRSARGAAPWMLAREHGVPLISHTGTLHSWAEPTQFTSQLERFPDVSFVVARAGVPSYLREVLFVAREYPNVSVLANSAFLTSAALCRLVSRLGADKIIFGSGTLEDLDEVEQIYRSAELSSKEEEQVMSGNAARLFKLPLC